ncbi:MAG: hypothetical protein JWM42_4041, partial [Burkholderia sp.]|nr:hypothetical protein [Burkholderia sp.]
LSQYGDWLKGGEVESAQDIAAGEGAILPDGHRTARGRNVTRTGRYAKLIEGRFQRQE